MYPLLLIACLVEALLSTLSHAQGTVDLDLSNFNLSDVSAGPYPKPPDILECNGAYGEGLDSQQCLKAIDDVPDSREFLKYVSHKEYAGQDAFVVPEFYYDDETQPSCVISVDLAGRSTTDVSVKIRKSTLRQLVTRINNACIIDNNGRAGFITYKLANTVYGISKFDKLPGGYNAPLFLTVQLSPKRGRLRPGDTDPHVNQAIQRGLEEIIPTKTLRSSKNKIIVLINALKETYERMQVGTSQAWWDNRHVTTSIPENVDYRCYGQNSPPRGRDCEDASFGFIGESNVVVGPGKVLGRQVGNCRIEVTSKEWHKCRWDTLRSAIDILLNTCLDGADSPGLGGMASARPLSASNGTLSSHNEQDSSNSTLVDVGTALPLPPTFQIEIFKAQPLQPTSGVCAGGDNAVNNTDGCVGYVAGDTTGNVTLQLNGGDNAVASLLPIAIESNVATS